MFEKKNSSRVETRLKHAVCLATRTRAPRCPRTLRFGEGLERVVTILFLSGQVSTSAINIYINVIIREHVTMYLLSAMPVVGFRVEFPFYKLYKVFPFPSSGATASRKSNEESRKRHRFGHVRSSMRN